MELRVLRYFLAVAREENITRAAELLHITQPTLSRQLAQLEEELGTELFKRGTRRLELTEAGFLLRRRAQELTELADLAARELMEQESLVEGCVSLGMGEVAAVSLLPGIIKGFRERHPKVSFEIFTGTADIVKERLERGLLDVGLLLEPVEIEKFAFIRLRQKERWAVLLSPDDPLAARESVSAKELSKRTLILPSRGGVRGELASWFGPYAGRLDAPFVCNLPNNKAIMVQQGLGCALVIDCNRSLWDERRLCVRPLSPPLEAAVVLAWKKHQPMGAAAGRFVEHLQCVLGMQEDE